MKKSKFNFYFNITFLAYCLWGFFLRNIIFCGNNIDSKIMIYYSGFAVFIIIFINKISKNLIYNCIKFKDKTNLKNCIINVAELVIVCVLIKILENNIIKINLESIWVNNRYDEIFSIVEFKDFILYMLLLNNQNASFLVLVNTIIVLIGIFLVIAYKSNISKNLIEDFIHYYFKYNYVIVFSILILILPKSYLYPNILSYVIIICLVIGIVFWLILHLKYKSTLDKKNKKLIIVVDESNFEFNMINKKNIYKKFSNYRTKNLLNIYGLENDNFMLVDYQLVRNKEIKLKNNETISYLIMFEASDLNLLQKSTKEDLRKFVADLSSSGKSFVIATVEDEECKLLEEFEEKYRENYKGNVSVRKIINELIELERNKELEEIIKSMIVKYDNIENKNTLSYRFVTNTMKKIDILDSTKTFYDLMKLCEYIIQYRALKNISNLTDKIDKNDLIKNSLGKWNKYQRNISLKINEDVYNSMKSIKQKLKLDDNIESTYAGVCDFIVSLRNKLIGHGNITYSVSNVIVKDLAIITDVIIEKFLIDNISLEENDLIRNVFSEDKKTYIKDQKDIYLLNFVKKFKRRRDIRVFEF